MKYLLHIDTSTDIGTIALSGDGEPISCLHTAETRNHAGVINNMITQLMTDAKVSLDDLSAITVCAGPGSYTGLRIGLATAKGLCYALDKPLMLDNKLTLLACGARRKFPQHAQYIALLTAREKEYFISIYDHDFNETVSPQHVTADQLPQLAEKNRSTYMLTDAPENALSELHINNNFQIDFDTKIDLESWAFYSFEKYNCNHFVNLMIAEPFYLKQVYTHK
jgi:tRNA threonylcarbamoyladenosine biosynthesis protein TsaB